MTHTERIPDFIVGQLESPLSGKTLELLSYVEEQGPAEVANLVTYHACTLAIKEKEGFFENTAVVSLLRLQEFLMSWQNDLDIDRGILKMESESTADQEEGNDD